MSQRTQKSSRFDLSRLLKWRGAGDSGAEETDRDFDPKAYYIAAWHILKHDVSLFLWKVVADFVRAALTMATVAFLAVLLVVQFRGVLADAPGPIAALDRFAASLATPGFIIGAVGLFFCTWLIGLTVEVLTLSGVWGTLADGTLHRPIRTFRSFFSNLSRRFPAVLALRVTTLAAQLTVLLLGATVVIAITMATGESTTLADASVWLQGLMWAAPLTLLAVLAALVRLTMELAAAPLILEQRSLGDAISRAAVMVTRNFAQVYRLLIVAAGLLLVPLFFYWGVLIFHNLALDAPELAPLVAILRLIGEVFLFAATGVIAVGFYGALFVYYAHQMAMIDELPDGDDDQKRRRSAVGRPSFIPGPSNPGGPNDERVDFDRDTTIEELLPEEYPNIVPLDDVLGGGHSEEASPQAEHPPVSGDDALGETTDDELRDDAPDNQEQENQEPEGDELDDDDTASGDDGFDSTDGDDSDR